MTGSKFLSQLNLTPDRFKSGKINVIKCPTGAGKTHYALNELPKFSQSNNCILFLTDTNMNKEQILNIYPNTKNYNKEWRKFINSHTKDKIVKKRDLNGWGTFKNVKVSIITMNYAEVGAIIEYGHPFEWSKLDYIVCDELHNLINFQNIIVKGKSVNILNNTKRKIEHTLYNYPDVKIIALTATPDKVYNNFKNTINVLTPQEYNILYQYETFNTLYYNNYLELLDQIPLNKKGIIYFINIRRLQTAEKYLKNKGHKAVSIWSKANKDKPMNENQIRLIDYITKRQSIPKELDILLINSACGTGVNIKNNDIDFMIIHSADKETITQVRGRLRNDLNLCFQYSPSYQKPIVVPDEYLNRPLSSEEKEYLCVEILKVWNSKENKPYKWKGVIKPLEKNGYKIINKTIKNKRMSIIEKL